MTELYPPASDMPDIPAFLDRRERSATVNPSPDEVLGYTRHPASAVWPDLTPDEYDRLRDNIFAQGQDHPILATPDKVVVDGWHRLKACAELDFEPKIVVCHFDEAEIAKKVIGAHTGRRHMTPSERADAVIRTMESCGLRHADRTGGRPPAPTSENTPSMPPSEKTDTSTPTNEPDVASKTDSNESVITAPAVADAAGVSEATAKRRLQARKDEQAGEQPDPGKKIESRARASAKRKRFDPLAEMQQKMEFWQELAETAQTELQTVRAELAAVLAEDEDFRADAIAEVKNNADALASQNAALVEANKKLREERDAALEEVRFHKEYADKVEEGLRNLSERGG